MARSLRRRQSTSIPETPEDWKPFSLPRGKGFSGSEKKLNTELIEKTFDLQMHLDFQENSTQSSSSPDTIHYHDPPVRLIFGQELPLKKEVELSEGSLTHNVKSTTSCEPMENIGSSGIEVPYFGCVCNRPTTRQSEIIQCNQCDGEFHTECLRALNHYHDNIDDSTWKCPFCTKRICYPIASKCSSPGTDEYSAIIAILDFMSARPSEESVVIHDLYSQFTYVA